ncbi:MAG TPA: hypothetical protein VNU95_09820 [Candidatus Acidoferrales bacterium]|jgi:hypothetical protein|nr:hypothetical protein [Candidatus Acidoferrales bacterium]
MNASAFSEPFTPRGVAAFARAKFSRLLLLQFIFAMLAAFATAWFFYQDCFPTVQAAIDNLPADSEIHSGALDWHGDSFSELADGRFVAFDVDISHSAQFRSSTADLQIEFGHETIRVFSLFGYADFYYPPGEISFNRTELGPLWRAWRAVILFLIILLAIIALLLSWWILATIYFLPVRLAGFFTNRELDLRASWKLSGAALLPGALLMTAGILFYGLGISLVTFLFIFGAHFVLGWLYLFFGLIFLPRTSSAAPKGNPFKPGKKQES